MTIDFHATCQKCNEEITFTCTLPQEHIYPTTCPSCHEKLDFVSQERVSRIARSIENNLDDILQAEIHSIEIIQHQADQSRRSNWQRVR